MNNMCPACFGSGEDVVPGSTDACGACHGTGKVIPAPGDEKKRSLDPNVVDFLLRHPMALTNVHVMMRNAATTNDDPKMVEWYKPVAEAKTREGRRAAWDKLIKR